jgi:hypothetical protein
MATPVSGAFAAAADDASVTAPAMAVTSDPPGANVYVDGRYVGQTPIQVAKLSAGDHRLRVIKAGYLENGRRIRIDAGRTSTVQVKLTPNAAAPAQPRTAGDDGGLATWAWYAIGAGAATAGYLLLSSNGPPAAGAIAASPATALQNGHSVVLTAQGASDPDGDTLDYSWDFGDGATGTGQTTSHIYGQTGTLTVTLTVSDGKEEARTTTPVTIRSLTGTWRGFHPFYGVTTVVLTQNGANVTGDWTDPAGPGSVSGNVTTNSPRIRLSMNFGGSFFGAFNADPNADVNTMVGTYSDPNGSAVLALTR